MRDHPPSGGGGREKKQAADSTGCRGEKSGLPRVPLGQEDKKKE